MNTDDLVDVLNAYFKANDSGPSSGFTRLKDTGKQFKLVPHFAGQLRCLLERMLEWLLFISILILFAENTVWDIRRNCYRNLSSYVENGMKQVVDQLLQKRIM